ncbi:hypothetical protein Sphch_2579 [Sphingobium chlorophenolicum L-1]|uniref:Uncharacterized protein n=1 Tax=Sphingobium chlorophenolicum L-1 TaxID=690566 RepID=F6EZP2_SPHCR|nr:hypothetical protein Sphch_2579 [Sphingobium chlorophenolicum L-1]
MQQPPCGPREGEVAATRGQLPDLTYEDEYRIARYLITKHRMTSPEWLARTMGVQWAQATRWLEAMAPERSAQ